MMNKPCKLAGCALHNLLSENETLQTNIHFDDSIAVREYVIMQSFWDTTLIPYDNHPTQLIDHRSCQGGTHPYCPKYNPRCPQRKFITPPTPQERSRYGYFLQKTSNNNINIGNRTISRGITTSKTRKHVNIFPNHSEGKK